MFKRLVAVTLLLVSTTQAVTINLSLDNASKLIKGLIAASVSVLSAEKAATSLMNRSDFRKNLVGLGMAYTISKLAPYARKNLQLKDAEIFENMQTKKEDRVISLIKGGCTGAITLAAAIELYQMVTNQPLTTYTKKDGAKVLNLLYATYNGGSYTLSKAQNTFRS